MYYMGGKDGLMMEYITDWTENADLVMDIVLNSNDETFVDNILDTNRASLRDILIGVWEICNYILDQEEEVVKI